MCEQSTTPASPSPTVFFCLVAFFPFKILLSFLSFFFFLFLIRLRAPTPLSVPHPLAPLASAHQPKFLLSAAGSTRRSGRRRRQQQPRCKQSINNAPPAEDGNARMCCRFQMLLICSHLRDPIPIRPRCHAPRFVAGPRPLKQKEKEKLHYPSKH
ncbi:hypothetical protein IWX49DRAFT_43265 [Phyllosticta citricarpa]